MPQALPLQSLYVKVDVEGGELEIVKGMGRLLGARGVPQESMAHALQVTTDHQTYRRRMPPQSRSTPEKSATRTRWRGGDVKNVNYPRAPSSRRRGLCGPHTTPR